MTKTWLFCLFIALTGCKKTKGDGRTEVDLHLSEESKTIGRIVGVDQFGRSFNAVSSMKEDKQVGLFFWLWIGQPYASGIYDASQILAMPNGLDLLTDFNQQDELVSPNGQAHFWGKPVWGYYNSADEWVLRKQMEMLTIAGIDFIYFDATNAFIYKDVFMKLLEVVDDYRKAGWDPPKIVFYTHSRSMQTVRELYRELYQPQLYSANWYRVNGKPMIIAYTNPADDIAEARSRGDNTYVTGPLLPEILNFFHFFRPQWPSDPVYPDGFPWVEWVFPQPVHNGVMNVTVASHPAVPMSFSLTRGLTNWGRGWNINTRTNVSADVDRGSFFQKQWDQAQLINPPMLSIGGWNEWIAYKQPYDGEYVLVDAVNKEYSRDIEPMEGGYEDAFYLQMIRNIRRYKGVEATSTAQKPATISIDAGIEQWNNISTVAININGSTGERNHNGAAATIRYTQSAPENKLQEVKLTHDADFVYFYIKANSEWKGDLTRDNWLNILVGTGKPELKQWESYEYLIGKQMTGNKASVGRLNAQFNSTTLGAADYRIDGNILQIACPKSLLGIGTTGQLYFKIAAGVDEPANIMSYYTSGTSLPMGRLSYLFEMGN